VGLFTFLESKSKTGKMSSQPRDAAAGAQPAQESVMEPESLPGGQTPGIAETVTDIDGNVYRTMELGNQVWTVENLRTTKYNDGAAIPLITDDERWNGRTAPGYCWYDNDTNNKDEFGALYNWYTVNTHKLAPAGWHVPGDKEWTALENYLSANGCNWDGTTEGNKIAKALAAKTDWAAHSKSGTIGKDLTINNASGFSALPGGFRFLDGSFNNFGFFGRWWCATEHDASLAYCRLLYFDRVYLLRYFSLKSCGFSVRLVRN
jgi:uncharacterized protein (TIGR02145 family)